MKAFLIALVLVSCSCGDSTVASRTEDVRVVRPMAFADTQAHVTPQQPSERLWNVNAEADLWAKFALDAPPPGTFFFLKWQLWYLWHEQKNALVYEYVHPYVPYDSQFGVTTVSIPGYPEPAYVWPSFFDANGNLNVESDFTVSGYLTRYFYSGDSFLAEVRTLDDQLVASGRVIITW